LSFSPVQSGQIKKITAVGALGCFRFLKIAALCYQTRRLNKRRKTKSVVTFCFCGVTKSKCYPTESKSEVTKSKCHPTKSKSGVTKSKCYPTESKSEVTKSKCYLTKLKGEVTK
jgi:hypothetical protein